MRLKTPLLLTITTLPLWLAMSAAAETMKMTAIMDVRNHQSRSTFEPSKDHPDEDWFYLAKAEADVEFEMRMSMSGQKDVVQKGRTDVGEVPGVTEGISGYKRARIETLGNEVTLVIETKLLRKKKKDGEDVDEREDKVERIPLEIRRKSESLDDVKSGKTIEFRITSAGLRAMLERGKAATMAGMGLHANGGEGSKVSASGWSKLLDSSRKGAVFVGGRRIEYEAPPTRVHAEAKARFNTDG